MWTELSLQTFRMIQISECLRVSQHHLGFLAISAQRTDCLRGTAGLCTKALAAIYSGKELILS